MLAQQIKEELNTFKMVRSTIHHDSKYTQTNLYAGDGSPRAEQTTHAFFLTTWTSLTTKTSSTTQTHATRTEDIPRHYLIDTLFHKGTHFPSAAPSPNPIQSVIISGVFRNGV
jgi:hypothetical protein